MFDKYNIIKVNSIDEYFELLQNGHHPKCLNISFDIEPKLKDKLKSLVDVSDDYKFAYLCELYFKYGCGNIIDDLFGDDEYELMDQYLLELINNSYIPAYIEFGLRGLRSARKDSIDKETYLTYITASLDHKDAIGYFEYGKYCLIEDPKYDANHSIELIEESAKLGYIIAYEYLGDLYLNDDFKGHDLDKAIYYFNMCEKNNYDQGICKLADIYAFEDDKRDINLAITLYEKANKLGNFAATLRLGDIYSEDELDIYDNKKALKYYLEAADQNDYGKFKLGVFLAYSDLDFKVDKKLTNVHLGIKYLEEAANAGVTEANCALGEIYYEGHVIKEDYTKAFQNNLIAADDGFVESEYFLAAAYIFGLGTKTNFKLGMKKLKQCSKNGVIKANVLLAYIYMHGCEFVEKDIDLAIKYLNKIDPDEANVSDLFAEAYIRKAMEYLNNAPDEDEKSKQRLEILRRIIDSLF